MCLNFNYVLNVDCKNFRQVMPIFLKNQIFDTKIVFFNAL